MKEMVEYEFQSNLPAIAHPLIHVPDVDTEGKEEFVYQEILKIINKKTNASDARAY
jgi:hypothetical protein